MSDIQILVGRRIRKIRKSKQLTMEQLAELSGLHHTYIGQLERGEKNATLTTLEKIAGSIEIPLSALLEQTVPISGDLQNIPSECRSKISSQPHETQSSLYSLLQQIVHLDS